MRAEGEGKVPVVFVFTADIIHLAPFCVGNIKSPFFPFILLNGVSPRDTDWVREQLPGIATVTLKTSLSKNAKSMLPHGDVINDLFGAVETDFCIQDPDCFVTEPAFWDAMRVDDANFAAGPFWENEERLSHVLPQTFMLMFRNATFSRIARSYGITAATCTQLPEVAHVAIRKIGYTEGMYPHAFKSYFDTLQAFWAVAFSEGLHFNKVPGSGKQVFHIGGTSYLHKTDYDLAHWDFWPLSVLYFNSRVLQLDGNTRFHSRFDHMFKRYSSSDDILLRHPEFADGWRRREIDHIVASFQAPSLAN